METVYGNEYLYEDILCEQIFARRQFMEIDIYTKTVHVSIDTLWFSLFSGFHIFRRPGLASQDCSAIQLHRSYSYIMKLGFDFSLI